MKKINKPSITCFDDAKHLMLEKFGRNYTDYCFFNRDNPSRNVLEFWNGFLCAMEVANVIDSQTSMDIWKEIMPTE